MSEPAGALAGDCSGESRGKPSIGEASDPSHFSKLSDSECTFPSKLHCLLTAVQLDGLHSVISWRPHGRAFVIHSQDRLATEVLPRWFRHKKFASFQRQLNIYGFSRLSTGPDKGAYYHPYFLRGFPDLCLEMARLKIKGTGCRRPSKPETEPNFWAMPPLHALQQSNASHTPATTGHFPPETCVAFRHRPLLDAVSLLRHGPTTTEHVSADSAFPVHSAGVALLEPQLAEVVPAPVGGGLQSLDEVAAALGCVPAPYAPFAFLDLSLERRHRTATELDEARSLVGQAQFAYRQHLQEQQQHRQHVQQQRLLELLELQCTYPTVWATLEAFLASDPGTAFALFFFRSGHTRFTGRYQFQPRQTQVMEVILAMYFSGLFLLLHTRSGTF